MENYVADCQNSNEVSTFEALLNKFRYQQKLTQIGEAEKTGIAFNITGGFSSSRRLGSNRRDSADSGGAPQPEDDIIT
jgi:hypothetical protein